MNKNCRLEKSDAEFVDIIHSCAGLYGYQRSHGHADFYPNNGKAKQPGCDGMQQVIGSDHIYLTCSAQIIIRLVTIHDVLLSIFFRLTTAYHVHLCLNFYALAEGCSHGRSTEFFAESIDSNIPFVSYTCESWEKFENGDCKDNSDKTDMGFPASPNSRGDYYLYTNSEPVFAKGDD